MTELTRKQIRAEGVIAMRGYFTVKELAEDILKVENQLIEMVNSDRDKLDPGRVTACKALLDSSFKKLNKILPDLKIEQLVVPPELRQATTPADRVERLVTAVMQGKVTLEQAQPLMELVASQANFDEAERLRALFDELTSSNSSPPQQTQREFL